MGVRDFLKRFKDGAKEVGNLLAGNTSEGIDPVSMTDEEAVAILKKAKIHPYKFPEDNSNSNRPSAKRKSHKPVKNPELSPGYVEEPVIGKGRER
ncbi:MAG: hypothetical protein FWC53_03690 [Firmicutes bacterium]|nr:hypothetical protein [Bacillota bacterium]